MVRPFVLFNVIISFQIIIVLYYAGLSFPLPSERNKCSLFSLARYFHKRGIMTLTPMFKKILGEYTALVYSLCQLHADYRNLRNQLSILKSFKEIPKTCYP